MRSEPVRHEFALPCSPDRAGSYLAREFRPRLEARDYRIAERPGSGTPGQPRPGLTLCVRRRPWWAVVLAVAVFPLGLVAVADDAKWFAGGLVAMAAAALVVGAAIGRRVAPPGARGSPLLVGALAGLAGMLAIVAVFVVVVAALCSAGVCE